MEQSQVQVTGDKKLRVGGHLRTLTAVFAIAALTGGGFAVAAGATVGACGSIVTSQVNE